MSQVKIKSYSGLLVLAAAIGLLLLVVVGRSESGRSPVGEAGSSATRVSASERSAAAPTPAIPSRADLEGLHRSEEFLTASLELALAGEPERGLLFGLYDKMPFANLVGYQRLGILTTEELAKGPPPPAFIVVSSIPERRAAGYKTPTNWIFIPSVRLLFVPHRAAYTKEWAGIRLAHELSHVAKDLDGSVPADASDAQSAEEEVRAHRFEQRLADKLSGGRFIKTIDAWLDEQASSSLPTPPTTWFKGPDSALFRRVGVFFPPTQSVDETATRRGALLVAMNVRLAVRTHTESALASSFDPALLHLH